MGKFGWSYPPGCSGPPDEDYGISPLVEDILGKLEKAGVPTEINDQIVRLIEQWEASQDRAPVVSEPPDDIPF